MPEAAQSVRLLEQYLQLEWVYAAEPEADVAEVEALVPPAEELAILAELAAAGDILALQARATELQQQNPQWRPFARKLERLAGRFEMEQIRVLLSRYQPLVASRKDYP